MCGVVGIYAYHYAANTIDREELRKMRDYMSARGPDGCGEWYALDGRVGLGHRRLAILDLSERGAQPMVSADRNLVVTFNGEIYNFRQLRAELENKGHIFRTDTDTEVLLHLYAEKGEAMVRDLRGMFAFGLWDAEKQALMLVRDPYGIKPLYYADDGWTLRFASQVKALVAGQKISSEPEPAGLVGFALFGSVPEPFTTYQEVRALPAGSLMWVDRIGTRDIKRYFSIAEVYRSVEDRKPNTADPDLQVSVRKSLLESVQHHLVSDVPVGAFLSGGVDSGALVGLMRDAGQREIQTITLTFTEFRDTKQDEAPLAKRIAAHYGTRHITRLVSEREFREDLPKILDAMDQPTIDGINSWFVSKAARELGLKVVISGLGGDELFGGYPSFSDIPLWARCLSVPGHIPWSGALVRRLFCKFAQGLNPKIASFLEFGGSYPGAYLLRRGLFMPWELQRILGSAVVNRGLRRLNPMSYIAAALRPAPRSSFGKVAALESSLYMRNQLLRDTDWASMAHSVEVRLPLVDATLLKQLAPLTGGYARRSKRLLANSPLLPLPDEVVQRAKTGFGTPIERWLQRDNRVERWKQIPSLNLESCAWARRWAFQLAAA
jgi:asparagine synthase (glutamine-hydrolysing)